jgi:hypothetical protein
MSNLVENTFKRLVTKLLTLRKSHDIINSNSGSSLLENRIASMRDTPPCGGHAFFLPFKNRPFNRSNGRINPLFARFSHLAGADIFVGYLSAAFGFKTVNDNQMPHRA